MTVSPITAMDLIVLVALLFTVGFVVAWMASADLRAWIERPKHRFLADVESYDQTRKRGSE